MKRAFFTFDLMFCFVAGFAQSATTPLQRDTTIRKNIEVVKEYNPVIKEAGKISTMPEMKDIKTEKKQMDISVWTTPYSIKPSTLPTLDFATVAKEPVQEYKERFARIGGGNYGSVLGELYTPFIKTKRDALDLYVKHSSSFGKVKMTNKLYESLPSEIKSRATDTDTKAKLSYKHSFKNKELSSFVDGGYRFFKYYGYDSDMQRLAENGVNVTENDSSKQSFTRLGANVRFRSKNFISRWRYDLQSNYQLFGNKDDLKEHTIHTLLNVGYRFDNSSLHLGFDMHNIIMNLPESNDRYHFERGETLNNYTVLKLNPKYYFSGEIGEITVGVKGSFSINQGKKGAVTPDVYGKVRLIKDILYVYAGVTGDYTVNNYQEVTKINPYISSDTRIEDTYTPIDAYVGLTLRVARRVDMDLHTGYKLIENPYFFVNRCDSAGNSKNTFDVVYDKKAGVFNAGFNMAYDWTTRLKLRFGGEFNKWALNDIEEAWHKPKWVMNLDGSYLVTNHLRLHLGYLLDAGKHALAQGNDVKLKNAHNLYFGANYQLLKWLDVFVNLDNVVNQEYAGWYGYTQHQFNLMGGVSMVF